MNSGETPNAARKTRKGSHTYHLAPETSVNAVRDILNTPGKTLKRSNKTLVQLVDGWVVKQSDGALFSRLLRLTLRRKRYRRGWRAAQHLRQHDVLTPRFLAYVETSFAGLITRNAAIMEYLDGLLNVEEFVRALIRRGAGPDVIKACLAALADAVNGLNAAGAYHADLSGKNIFTGDGRAFYFIDLDAVELGGTYTDERRMTNLVQLYDSFCDELNDMFLAPFLMRMLPTGYDPRVWLPRVRAGQRRRRARLARRREKQGRGKNLLP